jgi:acetyltransferase
VVIKGLVPGEVHKTEAGLVKLNLETPEQVEKAFNALSLGMKGQGKILLQQQIKGDLELIAGVVKDPQFGVCVMVGLGGVMAEILDDAVFGVAPLDHGDALALIGRLKHQKLLNGFRGAKGVDRDALAEILSALGQLAMEYPQIKEIDVNPLIIERGKPIAVDASLIVG